MRAGDLQRLLRSWQPALRREFLAAIAGADTRLLDVQLLAAIQAKDVQALIGILDAAAPDLGAAATPIAESFLAGAVEGAVDLQSAHVQLLAALQQTNPLATQAAAFAGQRIVAVDLDTKDAVADLIVTAFDEGVTVQDTARMIRSVVGLGPRDVRALANFTAQLADDGVDAATIATRSARYGQTLLNRRATTIARTEIMQASHAGQQALWDHAVSTGLLSDDSEKVWITASDPCPDCEDLDGQVVGVLDAFDGPDGPLDTPPAHPNCECTVGIQNERTGEATEE